MIAAETPSDSEGFVGAPPLGQPGALAFPDRGKAALSTCLTPLQRRRINC
jgi:hypothetical protein